MAISGQRHINIGTVNQATGSESLYDAFHKVEDNFDNLFANASSINSFRAGTGVDVDANTESGIVTVTNIGVTSLVPGSGITLSSSNGDIVLSVSGDANGEIVAGVTSVGLTSNTLNSTTGPIISNGDLNIELQDLTGPNYAAGEYIAPTITVDDYGRITQIASTTSIGTVTSIAAEVDGTGLSVSGSPITEAGTLILKNTGVTRLRAGSGITLSGNTGDITVSSTVRAYGTVYNVDVTSETLNITGAPIVTSGTIGIELPNDITLGSGDLTAINIIATGSGTINGNLDAYNISSDSFINAAGNITGENLYSNVNLVVVGNANVGNLGIAGFLEVSGNISGANIISNGIVSAVGNITGGNLVTAGELSVTSNASVGNLSTGGLIQATGNITGGNLITAGLISATGNITGGNLITAGLISATGNITGGNLVTSGALSVTGNANVGNIGGTGAIFTTVTGTLTTNAQPNITSVGTLVNLAVNGNVTVGGNFTVNGTVTSVNSTVVEIDDLAIVLANDASSSSLANGAGIIINGASANMLYIDTSNSFTFSHKISADGGLLSNITGANVTGQVGYAAVANSVSGSNVSGPVAYATTANSVSGSNVSGQVGNALIAGTVYTNAQPNITSVGTLVSLGVTGNITGGNLIGVHANGSSNVDIPTASGNVNISVNGTPNVLVTTATGVNVAGTLNATGNATSAQLTVTGNVITGNTGYLLMGQGGGLTGYLSAGSGSAVFGGYVTAQSYIFSNTSLAATPGTGTFSLDTANNRIGIYYGGSWHYASLTP